VARTVVRRLLTIPPIILVVTFTTFVLLSLNPTDPAEQLLGPMASQADVAIKRHELGLDEPMLERYGEWLGHALTGDLGRSLYTHTPVTTSLRERLGVTVSLTFGGLFLALIVGVPVGVGAAMRRGRPTDRLAMAASSVGQAVPSFWLATLLMLALAVHWQIFDAVFYVSPGESVLGWLRSVTLPSIALGLVAGAAIARHTRSSMVGALQQNYVRTAFAKGASQRQVVVDHALKNAAAPLVTVVGFQLTLLLGGSFVVERVFALPGLGSMAVDAITQNDPAPLLGFTLFVAVVVVVVNILIDETHAWLDPRVQHP
jgi:peptide/nickel transport system permease protein